MRIDPEECCRRAQIIDSLRTLMPRVDAVRRVYTAGLERRDAIAQEKRTLAGSLKNALAPSSLAFGLFILLIWIGVLGLALAQYDYAGAVLSLVSVAAKITQQIDEVETNIRVLLAEASATNEKEFPEFAEIYKQRRRLIHELERIPIEVPESGLLFDMHADEETAFQTAQAELTELERRLVEARHENGRVAKAITWMEKTEERSRALSRQETI